MSEEVKRIVTRLPNEEDGEYIKFPACLIRDNLALAIFDEYLEVHMVEGTDDPLEFDLVRASNPMFYVGNDTETVLQDVKTLTVVEFAKKYQHGDIID